MLNLGLRSIVLHESILTIQRASVAVIIKNLAVPCLLCDMSTQVSLLLTVHRSHVYVRQLQR